MSEESDENGSQEGRTPRKLFRLSAETLADTIVCRALPVIELYFSEDAFFDTTYFDSRDEILEYLKKLKKWFWEDTYKWLGGLSNSSREHLERAFTDVLDSHSEVMQGPRDQQLFTVLMCQLLFQRDVGHVLTEQCYGVLPFCKRLENFLESLQPFYTKSIDLSNFSFYKSWPMLAILKHMPSSLQVARLYGNHDGDIIGSLRDLHPQIEEILLELNTIFIRNLEDELFKVFFCGLERLDVLNQIKESQEIELSFPKLKKFSIIGNASWQSHDIHWFMFCLYHLYPNIHVKWPYKCSRNFWRLILDAGIVCPSFISENSICLDILALYQRQTWNQIGSVGMHRVPLTVKTLLIEADFASVMNIPQLPFNLLQRFQCSSLRLNYEVLVSCILRRAIGDAAKILTELYLEGPLTQAQEARQLYMAISSCVSLKILGIRVTLVADPHWEKLTVLPNLKKLSVSFMNYPNWFGIRTSNRYVRNYMIDRGMSTDLPAYMAANETKNLMSAWEKNSNGSANIVKGACASESGQQDNSTENGNVKLSLDTYKEEIFGPGPLIYDIPEPRLCEHGYGVLSAFGSYGQIEYNLKPRKPLYSYYDNAKYKYKISGCPKYKKSKNEESTASSLKGSSVLNLYDHIDTHTWAMAFNNHRDASFENYLKQWRIDMDFRAPLNLLGSLLSAAPGLRVLEIPDLRFHDVEPLFLNECVFKNISHVHTLHMYAQYTTPLVEVIKKFPALKILQIDPSYGVDNYLNFKSYFKCTNLIVKMTESEIFPTAPVE